MTTSAAVPSGLVAIGHVETPYQEVSHTPPQASLASGKPCRVVILDAFADGLLGLHAYEHIWLLTWLDQQPPIEERPLHVQPCSTHVTGAFQGVFACRYPTRPNPLGLSLVRLVDVDDNVLTVAGADVVTGTAVLDIKPWFADCDDPGAR
jgi:tRNA-Thr(GGU) m(6)t(6)A37 methyltransferase TsaA